MAGHVDEVPRVRNGPAQPIRIWLGTLWPIRRLDRVDVEMNGANMVWIVRQYALERRHDRRALRIWLAATRLPIIPWAQIRCCEAPLTAKHRKPACGDLSYYDKCNSQCVRFVVRHPACRTQKLKE